MIFSTVTFLYFFLPATLLLYYLVPDRLRNAVLLLFSLVFYAWGEPVYIVLMLYSILLNYAMGLLMSREREHRKEILVFTVIVNLFLLGFFKYYGFLIENLNRILPVDLPVRDLALPIGISFYTFQALSYDIDLYRGRIKAQKDPIAFAAYITMFPQLIAGPIVRYEDVKEQMKSRTITLARIGKGAFRFLIGLSKKVLIANLMGNLTESVPGPISSYSVATSWLIALGWTFQIYFDFSGYSDMAIGLGEMLGFSFNENFRFPYAAGSITEFWRRWHISLSTWFREYVYIPLGGNRVSVGKHIRNLLIVWLLTGLWHGAAWNFILWGLYYGLLLIFEKYVVFRLPIPRWLVAVVTRITTPVLVIFGWVIFFTDNLSSIGSMALSMTGAAGNVPIDGTAKYLLSSYGIPLLLALVFSMPFAGEAIRLMKRNRFGQMILFLVSAALMILCTAFLATQNYNPFLYFRF